MKRIAITEISGNEILAKPIWNSNGVMLIPDGTVLKKEFIPFLKDLDIAHINIEDRAATIDEIAVSNLVGKNSKIEMKTVSVKTINNIIGKQTRTYSEGSQNYGIIADTIINDVMNQEAVVFHIADIRNNNESEYAHALNVAALTVLISLKLDIPKRMIKEYATGALLHDLGMAFVPKVYSEIPDRELSDNDMEILKNHVIYGYEELRRKGFLSDISLNIVKNHHEYLDGSGYPEGLKGREIDLGSKIVSICDTFDQMVSKVPSKARIYEAVEFIQSYSGILFDSSIVQIFMKSISLYPIGTHVTTNFGETGVVIMQNAGFPTRPVIRMAKNADGGDYERFVLKNLLKEMSLFIIDSDNDEDMITIK